MVPNLGYIRRGSSGHCCSSRPCRRAGSSAVWLCFLAHHVQVVTLKRDGTRGVTMGDPAAVPSDQNGLIRAWPPDHGGGVSAARLDCSSAGGGGGPPPHCPPARFPSSLLPPAHLSNGFQARFILRSPQISPSRYHSHHFVFKLKTALGSKRRRPWGSAGLRK